MPGSTPTVGTMAAIDACRRELPATFDGGRLVFGFDGVVDNVRTMVDTRHDPDEYDRLERLADLRDRLDESLATRSSLTVEWDTAGTRTGGHACHLARAFEELGADTTMVGTYGRPPRQVFAEEFSPSALVSVGAPGVCDAVEFDDGKLLLTEPGEAARLDWELLTDRLGVDALADCLDGRDLLGVGYWSITAALPELLDDVVTEVWPLLDSPPERIFFDPGDIRSLPPDRISEGAAVLADVDERVPLTVSANRPETAAIAAAADGGADGSRPDGEPRRDSGASGAASDHLADAEAAFDALGVDQFVGHARSRSVTVTDGTTVGVDVPETTDPEMTTSAGDHFNAGFALGLLAGLSVPATTVLGNAVAGQFVRTGRPPTYDEITAFVESYRERL